MRSLLAMERERERNNSFRRPTFVVGSSKWLLFVKERVNECGNGERSRGAGMERGCLVRVELRDPVNFGDSMDGIF